MPKVVETFLNRELSWLEFNQRVLSEALDSDVPLLERLNFLSITASNLDEFFMVRVASLQGLEARGITRPDPSGLTPSEQLKAINRRVHGMMEEQYRCFQNQLEPELAAAGIQRVSKEYLAADQIDYLERLFEESIFPVLTPIAVSSHDALPALPGLGLVLAVRLAAARKADKPRLALIPLGIGVDRFVTLPADTGYRYVLLEDVVEMCAQRFFPGLAIQEVVPFRITRNADLGVKEDEAPDLLSAMEAVLVRRKQSDCVRLEVASSISRSLRVQLERALDVMAEDVYSVPGPLDLAAFRGVAALPGFDALHYEPWPPQPIPAMPSGKSLFDVISRGDVLLSHPYDSFEPVQRLVEEAASDPEVLAIKQILYRTSAKSPIVAALKKAAERGKNVTAIVELKARFDEARNIEWARELERSGAQVLYGVKGLKTHAKLLIIVRREPQGVARYLHFGTGNYNERTARLYSDVGLMTRDRDLASDASAFFNAISGYSEPRRYLKIEAAPLTLREKILELIDDEIQRRKQGQKAFIRAKMNSLVDPDIVRSLYRASRAGVKVQLNVRGICCLRPGVRGQSENIMVVSIVDRFLEHSRILHVCHGGDDQVFISSADWMPRNLDRRVELLVPVDDAGARRALCGMLDVYFRDNVKSWKLLPDGHYERLSASSPRKVCRSQAVLYRQARDRVNEFRKSRRAVFEPHRPQADREGGR
jgi:polyphosphate kinase